VFICLSLCLSVHLYVCPSACLSVCLSIRLSVCLSICLSVCLSVCLSTSLYIGLSVCLSVCLSIYLSMRACTLQRTSCSTLYDIAAHCYTKVKKTVCACERAPEDFPRIPTLLMLWSQKRGAGGDVILMRFNNQIGKIRVCCYRCYPRIVLSKIWLLARVCPHLIHTHTHTPSSTCTHTHTHTAI